MHTYKAIAAAAALGACVFGPVGAQQRPSDDGTAQNGPITILKNMQVEGGGMRVSIDGREVDHLRTAAYDDITSDVHRGQNTLTVRWNGPVQSMKFTIAHAATRNNFRTLLAVQANATSDATLRRSGSRTLVFTIPD